MDLIFGIDIYDFIIFTRKHLPKLTLMKSHSFPRSTKMNHKLKIIPIPANSYRPLRILDSRSGVKGRTIRKRQGRLI